MHSFVLVSIPLGFAIVFVMISYISLFSVYAQNTLSGQHIRAIANVEGIPPIGIQKTSDSISALSGYNIDSYKEDFAMQQIVGALQAIQIQSTVRVVDRSRSIDVALPTNVDIRTESMSYDPDHLNPHFVDTAMAPFFPAYATIHVGSYTEDLFFVDNEGQAIQVPIRIPVHALPDEYPLVVYTSSDGIDWKYHWGRIKSGSPSRRNQKKI